MTLDLRGPDCPGCGGATERVPAPAGVLAGCRACGGMWADVLVSKVLATGDLSARGKAFAREIAEAAGALPPGGYRARAPTDERRCPTCRERLVERPYGDPPLVLDVCNAHGTFFDVREVEAVNRHVEMIVATAEAAGHVAVFEARYKRAQEAWYGDLRGQGPIDGLLALFRLVR